MRAAQPAEGHPAVVAFPALAKPAAVLAFVLETIR
jgi:hypothetical protein